MQASAFTKLALVSGRTIIVGDVHGCARELAALLKKLAITDDDHVVMVGDTVVRGPEPHEVLKILRDVGARSVRGNHENRLIRFRALHPTKIGTSPAERRLRENVFLRRTADRLDEDDWAYVEAMPLWLDLPEHDVRVVHAGVMPGVEIQNQTDRVLMYLRRLDGNGGPSERNEGGELWARRYEGPPHICFGHNALVGLQLAPWATGLDTGCVYGNELTAMVLPRGAKVPRMSDERRACLVSVPAAQAYYATSERRPA